MPDVLLRDGLTDWLIDLLLNWFIDLLIVSDRSI